jgi:ABC-type polysaccharide/polyol phosphate export systems, permease component
MKARPGTSDANLLADLISSLRNPAFWAFSAWLDLVTKYRRSSLGLIWVLMPPLCYIFGIGYFYSSLSKVESLPFMLHLGIGYVLWKMITQVITGASTAMAGHRSFIFDGRVRYTDYVLRVMSKSLFYFAVTVCVLTPLLLAAIGVRGAMTLAITLPIFMANVLWLGVVIGVIGARFPDMHEFSSTIFIFGFLLTPIVWRAELTPPDTMRGFVARLNPAFHLIEFVRAPLLGDPVEINTIWVVLGLTILGWACAMAVYRKYSSYIPIWL